MTKRQSELLERANAFRHLGLESTADALMNEIKRSETDEEKAEQVREQPRGRS